ncbi:MAG TPA: hypothetical protein PK014_07295 [Thermoanaerobaculia bacterium]|nr:hypothetical protein [Thermoanaerobaculia bacterium]HUM29949.1 hypothetical protein [Thermoanaerobaculia bacterium]HXK68184.1 hypothetical protein [Thermoanaerobaculia bacterium]
MKKTLLSILALFFVIPCFAESPGNAYIMLGDIDQNWFITGVRWLAGKDSVKDLEPVFEAYRQKFEARGYHVIMNEVASYPDLKNALLDPNIKALAWFSHGNTPENAPSFTSVDDREITGEEVQRWAREKLARTYPWMQEIIDGLGVAPKSWRTEIPREEYRWRKSLYEKAHMELEEVYLHVCYSMRTMTWRDLMLKEGGVIRGYPDKAYLDDRSRMFYREIFPDLATTIEAKPARSYRPGETFVLSSTDEGGTTQYKHEWTLPSGEKVTQPEVEITAGKPGTYTVFMTLYDSSVPVKMAEARYNYEVSDEVALFNEGANGDWNLEEVDFEVKQSGAYVRGSVGKTPTSDWTIDRSGFHFKSRKDGYRFDVTWEGMPDRIALGKSYTVRVKAATRGPRNATVYIGPVGPIDCWEITPYVPNDTLTKTFNNGFGLPLKGKERPEEEITNSMVLKFTLTKPGIRLDKKEAAFLELDCSGIAKIRWTYAR